MSRQDRAWCCLARCPVIRLWIPNSSGFSTGKRLTSASRSTLRWLERYDCQKMGVPEPLYLLLCVNKENKCYHIWIQWHLHDHVFAKHCRKRRVCEAGEEPEQQSRLHDRLSAPMAPQTCLLLVRLRSQTQLLAAQEHKPDLPNVVTEKIPTSTWFFPSFHHVFHVSTCCSSFLRHLSAQPVTDW